jgi:hypothetical protein
MDEHPTEETRKILDEMSENLLLSVDEYLNRMDYIVIPSRSSNHEGFGISCVDMPLLRAGYPHDKSALQEVD